MSNAAAITFCSIAAAVIAVLCVYLLRPDRRLPAHPERMVEDDAYTDHLAILQDELWPDDEYLGAYHCPTLLLPVYDEPAAAFLARPGSTPFLCVCGSWHVKPRRRRPHHPKPTVRTETP